MLCSRPYKPSTSVGLNPVHGFSVRDFWRVHVGIHSLVLVDKLWFGWVWSSVFLDLQCLGSACFWPKWIEVQAFGGVRMGSKFGFGGWTWVQMSLKFDLSILKQSKVRYVWVWSNTTFHILAKGLHLQMRLCESKEICKSLWWNAS